MNPGSLLATARVLAVLAVVLLALQLLWSHYRQRRQLRDEMRRRLAAGGGEVTSENGARVTVGYLESILLRADIHLSRSQLMLMTVIILGFLFLAAIFNGFLVALITAGLIVVGLWMYWRMRLHQQRRRIYEELPVIIDSTLRYIDAGRSLENALVEAFKDAPAVFDPLSFRLRSAVESGRDYTQLFEDFARLYKVPSMVVVAIALRTSARFGSSIRPVLRQVSASLRSQQELRREFLAATAEIRFTAVAFALLPLGLTAYMILVNKSYSEVLLDTATGHMMLGVAGVLQALGMIIMWRMIQGVGRD